MTTVRKQQRLLLKYSYFYFYFYNYFKQDKAREVKTTTRASEHVVLYHSRRS